MSRTVRSVLRGQPEFADNPLMPYEEDELSDEAEAEEVEGEDEYVYEEHAEGEPEVEVGGSQIHLVLQVRESSCQTDEMTEAVQNRPRAVAKRSSKGTRMVRFEFLKFVCGVVNMGSVEGASAAGGVPAK